MSWMRGPREYVVLFCVEGLSVFFEVVASPQWSSELVSEEQEEANGVLNYWHLAEVIVACLV
jgi:hypothetical protein